MGKKNNQKKKKKATEKLGNEAAEGKSTHEKLSANASHDEKEDSGSVHSIERLLDKAEELIDEFNFELAQKFCQRALETEPDNVRALEVSASMLMELGQTESAKQCLGRAVEVSPAVGFSKYMTLGQLMEGAEAVQCYQKGIELMLKEKESKEAQEVMAACRGDNQSVTNQDISTAYCAIAEIYLTDCCFDESAEEKCGEFVNNALTSDPDNAEAWQVKANWLMSRDQKEEAKVAIKKSISLWLPKLQAADEGTSPEDDFDPVEMCPLPYTARVQSGKILIELEEYEEATDCLETLLDEDDEVPDVWYLLGWANYLNGKEYYSNARHYLHKAKEVFTKIKYQDMELLGHIEELVQELGPEEAEEGMKNGAALEIDSSDEEDMDL